MFPLEFKTGRTDFKDLQKGSLRSCRKRPKNAKLKVSMHFRTGMPSTWNFLRGKIQFRPRFLQQKHTEHLPVSVVELLFTFDGEEQKARLHVDIGTLTPTFLISDCLPHFSLLLKSVWCWSACKCADSILCLWSCCHRRGTMRDVWCTVDPEGSRKKQKKCTIIILSSPVWHIHSAKWEHPKKCWNTLQILPRTERRAPLLK